MKKYLTYALAAVCCAGFVSCSDDDDEPKLNPDVPSVAEGVFILNQGNYGKQIEGSLTLIDYATTTASQELFQKANGRSMGSTPQAAIVYGSKIYIGVYGSNTIEIINRNTYKSVKQISLAEETGQSPRSLVAKDGKVYISMYNGYVSRLDTLSMSIDKTVQVGPNPEIMAIKGDYLYVPNSDGMNWQSGYGKTASKIRLSDFSVEKTFEVGLNPAEFVSNGTDLFLLCKGNYGDIASTIYKINDKDESEKIAEATLLSIKGNNLYYINAPYGASEIEYKVYDINSKEKKDMIKDNNTVVSPAGLAVDPVNGNIIISSYVLDGQKVGYAIPGYANVYKEDGTLLRRYEAGVGPVVIFFNYK